MRTRAWVCSRVLSAVNLNAKEVVFCWNTFFAFGHSRWRKVYRGREEVKNKSVRESQYEKSEKKSSANCWFYAKRLARILWLTLAEELSNLLLIWKRRKITNGLNAWSSPSRQNDTFCIFWREAKLRAFSLFLILHNYQVSNKLATIHAGVKYDKYQAKSAELRVKKCILTRSEAARF